MARTISTKSTRPTSKRKSSTKSTTPTTRKRLGIGYIRVSRKGQRGGENYITEDQQRERIEAIAKAQGITIVRWEVDIDQSGKKWNRPGFQSALRAIEDGDASCIVVAKLNRFARTVLNVHRGIEQLAAEGAQLVAGDISVDTSTKEGKLMRSMLAALAEFELDVITENWADARARAVERGVAIGAQAATGYMYDTGKRLVRDPEYADLVVELFRRRAAGETWRQLDDWWYEQTGWRTANGTLRGMIGNRTYLGESRHGDFVNKDAHEALVTQEEWDAAQPTPKIRKPRGEGALLTGIMQCGSCGGTMTTSTATSKRANGERVSTPMYRCWRQAQCEAPVAVVRAIADEYVEAEFLAWAEFVSLDSDSADETELMQARQALDDARGELSAFLRVASAADDEELFAEGVEARRDAVDEAQTLVAELDANRRAGYISSTINDEWRHMTTEQRRQILSACIVSFPVQRTHGSRVPFGERAAIAFRS